MIKQFSSVMLAAALTCSLCAPASAAEERSGSLEHFQKSNTFVYGQFVDVPDNQWYVESVASAFEYGLMLGTSPDEFSPNGNITLGATLAMASRIHSTYYTGSTDFTQGSPWYQTYVDYCLNNGIIDRGYDDYNVTVTRAEFASILAKSLPAEALTPINNVEDGAIPDVPVGGNYSDSIYTLYRAGILTGNDAKGTFTPNSSISRSSVAAIITRMALPTARKSITLTASKPESAEIFFYEIFPDVPDFGKLVGVPVANTKSIEGESYGYFYDADAVRNSDYGENSLVVYDKVLQANGFTSHGYSTDPLGSPVWGYENGQTGVYVGSISFGGQSFIYIVLSVL